MDGDDTTKYPQMRSRNFSVKSMFIGVVGRPRPDNNFDCHIFLERISKTCTITKGIANQRFSDDILINFKIKNRKWRQFHVPDMICDDIKKIVGDVYEVEDYIIERLEFPYKQIVGKRAKQNIFELTLKMNFLMIIILNYLKLV